jgi:hypothetical protein
MTLPVLLGITLLVKNSLPNILRSFHFPAFCLVCICLKFGSEAWVLKKREEQRLEAAQIKFLNTWNDKSR